MRATLHHGLVLAVFISALSPARFAHAASESVLYSFGLTANDGQTPVAGLINVGGTLYGTLPLGGAHSDGALFKVTTAGAESLVYSFGRTTSDGVTPASGLINGGGTFYGTTEIGGMNGEGTVFKVTNAGVGAVLYTFGRTAGDAVNPVAGLIDVGGTFYGTAEGGGAHGGGAVFKVTATGVETVLHSFGSGADGSRPLAGLINVGGALYGTTDTGGMDGGGTVFKVTIAGVESVLHSFGTGADGRRPAAGLINVGSIFYGTTAKGGVHGCGTVFKMTSAGVETILHSFRCGINDGVYPVAGVIDVGGSFYGTTEEGGAVNGGTVFKVTAAGVETVLYSFGGGFDGLRPLGGLVNVGGAFYGTTNEGGLANLGTVFKVTP